MTKVYLFVAKEEMMYQAHAILQEHKYPIDNIEVIETNDSERAAQRAEEDGAGLIIARGLQAERIKAFTKLPVIEIVLTFQEIAVLINKAKKIVKKAHPRIAIIGFKNMFGSMDYIEEFYDIELITCFRDRREELETDFYEVIEQKPDLIIGGDFVIRLADKEKIRSLYLFSMEESLKNAFIIAEKMVYAMDIEKKTEIQLETIMDYSFNAALRTREDGSIVMANAMMEDLLGKKEEAMMNKPVWETIPNLSEEIVRQVLKDGREYSLMLQIGKFNVYSLLAPILMEDNVDGIFVNCHKIKRLEHIGERVKSREKEAEGHLALGRFEDLCQESECMKICIHKAKRMISSDRPLMIQGEAGTERRILAQSIHNESHRNGKPFIDVTCAGLNEEAQQELIFGMNGAAMQANGGTLFLRNIDKLTLANQYRLYQLIRFKMCSVSDLADRKRVDVRIMFTTKDGLERLVKNTAFREDLYYALSGLNIKIPPLRERPEDLKKELEDAIHESCEKNARYHVLTKKAWEVLMNYPWYGNQLQIMNFCENMVISAIRRSIDENEVTELLLDSYPEISLLENRSQKHPFEGEEAALIRRTLEKNLGNREKTALELKIGKSTLWRKMKKYNIK